MLKLRNVQLWHQGVWHHKYSSDLDVRLSEVKDHFHQWDLDLELITQFTEDFWDISLGQTENANNIERMAEFTLNVNGLADGEVLELLGTLLEDQRSALYGERDAIPEPPAEIEMVSLMSNWEEPIEIVPTAWIEEDVEEVPLESLEDLEEEINGAPPGEEEIEPGLDAEEEEELVELES